MIRNGFCKTLVLFIPIVVITASCIAAPTVVAPTIMLTATTTAPTPTATQLPVLKITDEASSTPRLVQTPIAELSSTPTQVLPTPVLPHSSSTEFQFSDFFFDNLGYPKCELPCWKGLQIGSSDPNDVQQTFDTVFDFRGTLNFLSDSPLTKLDLAILGFDPVPSDLHAIGYQWRIKPTSSFSALAMLASDSSILRRLIFTWSTPDISTFQVHMTPDDMINHLGTPSHMLASVETGESADLAISDLLIVYDSGIVYWRSMVVPIMLKNDFTGYSVVAKYCLGNDKENVHPRIVASVYIMEPFTTGLDNLTSFQQFIVERRIKNRRMIPFEELFGVSLQQIVKLAQAGGSNCLFSKNLRAN